jgi:hypothetical protein
MSPPSRARTRHTTTILGNSRSSSGRSFVRSAGCAPDALLPRGAALSARTTNRSATRPNPSHPMLRHDVDSCERAIGRSFEHRRSRNERHKEPCRPVAAGATAARRMHQRVGPRGLPTRAFQAMGVAERGASSTRAGGRARWDSIWRAAWSASSRRKARRLATRVVRRPVGCGRIASVRVERNRENVFTVTATGQELSALVAGARLALDAMRASADAPATAIELLGRVLDDFDRSRERLAEPPNGDRP